MKKNNEMSFDSFIIVESEDKKQEINKKSQNSLKTKIDNLPHKKIRDKFLGENNTNNELNKIKEKSEKNDDFNSIINNFELFESKEDLENDEINASEEKEEEIITKNDLKNDGFINITPLSKEKSPPTIEICFKILGPSPINIAPFTGDVIFPFSIR